MNGLLYPQPQGSLMDPRAAMLTQMGLGMMQASGPSMHPVSLGQAFGQGGTQGMQAGQQVQQSQQQEAFRQFQMQKAEEELKLAREKAMREKLPQAPKIHADAQGVMRYTEGPSVGQVVPGFNSPRMPEGFELGPNGRPQPVPEYWEQKKMLAEAGRPSTVIENYANPIPVLGPDGKPAMVQFGKHGEIRPTPFKPVTEDRPPADSERTAAGFAARMLAAERIIEEVGPVGDRTVGTDAARRVPIVGAYAERASMTPEQQKVRQAQEDWVTAKLRPESGAVIAKEEMDKEIEMYFPQPGDRPENIEQKRGARGRAAQGIMQRAGRAAPKANTDKVIPKSKQFKLDDGKSVIGILEPNTGKYYVVRGGKKFYVEE